MQVELEIQPPIDPGWNMREGVSIEARAWVKLSSGDTPDVLFAREPEGYFVLGSAGEVRRFSPEFLADALTFFAAQISVMEKWRSG